MILPAHVEPHTAMNMERQNIVNRIQFMEREIKAVEEALRHQSRTPELVAEHATVKAELLQLYTQLTNYDLK
jgi:hypothetical protein